MNKKLGRKKEEKRAKETKRKREREGKSRVLNFQVVYLNAEDRYVSAL